MIKAALHVHLSEPLFIHLESGTTQLWGCCENETSLCYAGGERCVRCAPFRPQGRFLSPPGPSTSLQTLVVAISLADSPF